MPTNTVICTAGALTFGALGAVELAIETHEILLILKTDRVMSFQDVLKKTKCDGIETTQRARRLMGGT